MNPDDIRKLAEKERKKQEKRVKKQVKPKEPKQFVPVSPESWRIYSQIYPGGFNTLVWGFLIFGSGFIFLCLYGLGKYTWALYPGLELTGIFLLRLGIYHLIKVLSFRKFKTWRKTLPFALHGWETLGQKKDFPTYTRWNLHTELLIHFKTNPSSEVLKLTEDALFLFVSQANKYFYEPNFLQAGFAGEIRKKWRIENIEKPHLLTVSGSANSSVIGEIYVFINRYLRSIYLQQPVIESVTVRFGKEIYEVATVETD